MTDLTEICPICHDSIEITTHGPLAAYKLPECGHTFHTECAVNWFRHSPRCPMCNDMGASHDSTFTSYLKVKSAYADASAMARKKTAKPEWKRQYEKISKLNQTIKSLTAQKTEIMGETGVFREMRKRYTAMNRKRWRANRQLYREKRILISMCPRQINVIIPRRVTVGNASPSTTHATHAILSSLPSTPPDSEGEDDSSEGDEEEGHHLST